MPKKILTMFFVLVISLSILSHLSFSASTDVWLICDALCEKKTMGDDTYYCGFDSDFKWYKNSITVKSCNKAASTAIGDSCSGTSPVDDDSKCGDPTWSNGGCTGISECSGKTVGTNITYCTKGGQTYFADKCSSTCQGQDRDDVCRSSAFASDCTADSQCNGVKAGTSNCDSTCKYTPGCSCGSWSNTGCGGTCPSNQMKQTRTCTPNCVQCTCSQCVGPSYGSWINQGCGISCGGTTCLATQQCQKRTDSYGCAADQYQCVDDATCGTSTTTTTTTLPPSSTTTVSLNPSYVAAGQSVTLTVEFNYTNYKKGQNANISLYIIPPGCGSQSCYVRWDNSNGCPVGWEKFTTIYPSFSNSTPTFDGTYGNKSVKINSQNEYAKLEATCTIPQGLPSGTYTVRAIPTVYSLPITLRAAEANFIVLNDFEIVFQKIFDSISSAIQQMFVS